MSLQLPPCPVSLKSVQHYLKTASEHDGRDPVISYWCRLYALESAMKIDRKSDEAKIMLVSLMDWLEKEKKRLHDNEAITNNIAAQAHIENYALKLFLWADGQDRAAQFNKNVVKAFYTAGFLMDVLTMFGEQSEEIQQNCKYAKWKSAYIHNCLKNGEVPIPGPAADDSTLSPATSGYSQPNSGFEEANIRTPSSSDTVSDPGAVSSVQYPTPPPNSSFNFPTPPSASTYNIPQQIISPTPPTPSSVFTPTPSSYSQMNVFNDNGVKLQPEQITKAQKYCKFASSALNYDDVKEAICNLQKALTLLTTGQDS